MEEKRVADYFLVVGRPEENPLPLDELSNESVLKPSHKLDPIVDIAVINRSFGEVAPAKFKCIEFTPTGFPADLNHGSIRAPEMYLCYRRGRDKPPLVDIGVLYDGKDSRERVLMGCEVIYNTVQGRSANVNNSGNTRIYITYRRASPSAACDTLAVTDICVILLNKGEVAPHAYHMINKTLNKGMMGSDVYLCYKKSMTKTNVLAYKPVVLSRYPETDLPGFPLPDRVAMFCLPLGATLECWPANTYQPLPVFSTFILTAASGDKVYGAAVTFYEFQDEKKLDEAQCKQLGLPDTHVAADGGGGGDGVGVLGTDGDAGVNMTVHQNKCICLISSFPFFETFKKFLGLLYKTSRSGSHPLPIERYVAHFLHEVPFPSLQRPRILVQFPTTAITLSQPDETPLPKSGASFIELLKNLGPTNCITVLLFTLMEQKLLIHSLRPAVLTSVAEAISNIIFPFHWQCPYIPLCPLALSYVLNSPTPFIVGIDSRYFDLYDPPSDVTCIDLDTNTLTLSEDRKGQTLKMMPKKAVKVLKATLEKLYEVLCVNPGLLGTSGQEWLDVDDGQQSATDFSGWKKEMHMETSIQEAFLRFMSVILKGYNNFLLPIIKAPTIVTTDVSNLFDIQGFLKSRDRAYHKFFGGMMKTQAFSRFIEERSFVSDKDTCLAFFDECVEKVDENSHEVRLIDLEDSLQSERTVFILPPEPVGLPDGVEYSYNGFPLLDSSLFPPVLSPPVASQAVATLKNASGDANICSPMTRRTKHELRSAQKIAMKHSNIPKMWAHCLVWHCYSLWFIHLPAYMKTVHSKTKALRIAYEVLGKAQLERLQPPDEVCYRVMMQLCGLYHQPVMAVKLLFEMKRNGVEPNAVTYGFYNKAVLESKWPTANARGSQLWTQLRHVILAVAQFKRSWNLRRHSVYSNSESEDLDGQSLDSFLESESVGSTIMKDLKTRNQGKRSRTGSETGPGQASSAATSANDERISTGGLSDRGYGSATFEESKRISLVLGSQNSLDLSGQVASSASERTPTESNLLSSPKTIDGDESQETQVLDDDVTSPSSSCETVASSLDDAVDSLIHKGTSDDFPESADDVTPVIVGNGDITLIDHNDGDDDHVTPDDTLNFESRDSSADISEPSSVALAISSPVDDLDVDGGKAIATSPGQSGLLMPVTENDPLGVFSPPLSEPAAGQPEEEQKEDRSARNSQVHFSDIQPFGGASMTLSAERTSGTVDGTSPPKDPAASAERGQSIVSSKKSKASNRGEILGSVMRSAATRLFSKYTDLKKSLSTQNAKTNSGSLTSVNNPETDQSTGTATSEASDTDDVSTNENEVVAPAETTPSKNRLRVPGLYAPLASVWGGLKTLQTKEALQGLASSLEHMTASVRGSIIDTWNYSVDPKDGLEGIGEEEEEEDRDVRDSAAVQLDSGDDESSQNGLSLSKGHGDLDQLIPVEENSDQSSLTGDQSSFRFSTGSMLSLPQSSAPVEVEMCTLSKCQACGNLLYDEEIMAGWTSDDSNLSTRCQFCGVGFVPFIHIYIRDYRQSMISPMSNLSQSVESMLSVQSAPISANPRRKEPSDRPPMASDASADVQQQQQRCDADGQLGPTTTALETMKEISVESDDQTSNVDRPVVDADGVTSSSRVEDESVEKSASNGKSGDDAKNVVCDLSDGKDCCSGEVRCCSCAESAAASEAPPGADLDLADACKENDEATDAVKNDSAEKCESCDNILASALKDRSFNEASDAARTGDRWRSKDLELGLTCPPDIDQPATDSLGRFNNRRCTSECSLNLLRSEMDAKMVSSHHSKRKGAADVKKTLAEGNGSDGKTGLCVRKCVELDPITVPYLSPLVLRKELENVLDQEGDLCLSQSEFVDQHPIIYWNLVWYFRRLDVPSQMPGFILNSKSLNNTTPTATTAPPAMSNVWSSGGDSRHVSISCMWDNIRLHDDHGPPMYILWNQVHGAPSTSDEFQEMFSKNMMISIVTHIKKNDVISPLRLILKERNKRRMQTSKTRFHSIYRDLLFLSFTALGRENIDHEAFDREFKSMFLELPAHDSARLRIADRTPSSTAIWCRKMFHELNLPAF